MPFPDGLCSFSQGAGCGILQIKVQGGEDAQPVTKQCFSAVARFELCAYILAEIAVYGPVLFRMAQGEFPFIGLAGCFRSDDTIFGHPVEHIALPGLGPFEMA